MSAAIDTPYGADVCRVFAVYGIQCDPEKDAALFVIRDRSDKVFYYAVLKPEYSEELQTYIFNVHITHKDAERIPKGSYKYGLTFYKDAIYGGLDNAIPEDGSVVVPIARMTYSVYESVAREEGLR